MRSILGRLLGLGLLLPAVVFAQTHGESTAGLQFNFGLPGARSLGMGGAFLGRSDDATAAQQNPAGLVNLSQSEVAVEFKQFDYSNIFTDRGYVGPTTANFPAAGYPRELEFGADDQEASSLSYASYVLARPNWAWAIYRHQLVDFEAEFQTFGASTGFSLPNGQIVAARLFPIDTATEVDVESYGTSLAFRLGSSFSIGVGAAFHQYEAASFTNRFQFPNSVDGPRLNTIVSTEAVVGDDDDVTFNLGFQWKAGERVSFGGSYRQGPEFAGSYEASNGGQVRSAVAPFKVPDAYGVGVSIAVTTAFTVAFDAVRIEYGDLAESLVPPAFTSATNSQFVLDDGTELRLGLEYALLNLATPVRLRAGVWQDPAHTIRYQARGIDPASCTNQTCVNQVLEDILAVIAFAPGEDADDEIHYSAGVGVVFLDGKFLLDAAADFSELIDTFSLSGVIRW